MKLTRPQKTALAVLMVVGGALLFLVWNLSGVLLYPNFAGSSCRAGTLLVMGAAQYNGAPSPAFQRRLDKASELYDADCASRIIVTGGQREGDVYSEGGVGVSYLEAQGVPAAALLSETTSRTSYENLLNSRELVPDKQLTIVTDDLHAYRTNYLAGRLGYEAELEPVYAPYERFGYTLSELLHARTDDEVWNAGQRQFLLDGYMHNNLRMYWGKQILRWTSSPKEAWNVACYLNDRLSYDGRDPATYGNLEWVFGRARPGYREIPVYGKVAPKSDRAIRGRKGMPDWIDEMNAREDMRVSIPNGVPDYAEPDMPLGPYFPMEGA